MFCRKGTQGLLLSLVQDVLISYQFRLHRRELLTVDCWLLTVEGGVEKLNG
jgi:hypothetical protein